MSFYSCVKVVGDLPTYRLSREKTASHLRAKVERLASQETREHIPSLERALARDGFGIESNVDELVRGGARTEGSLFFFFERI
jgi:hypothetical protein